MKPVFPQLGQVTVASARNAIPGRRRHGREVRFPAGHPGTPDPYSVSDDPPAGTPQPYSVSWHESGTPEP
jgi:hypothetical protein